MGEESVEPKPVTAAIQSPGPAGPLAEAARRQAKAAARRSGAIVRPVVELAEIRQIVALFDKVWDNAGPPPIGVEHIRALAHAGNFVAGAFDDETGALLGATVAFFAAPPGHVLHSDITGVDATARDRRLGFALKAYQRAWALDRGLDEVTWTFDPLMSRNAHFNLVKLMARCTRYYVDFYGDMDDGVNVGQGSDRLLAAWRITSPEVASACDGDAGTGSARADPAPPALLTGPDKPRREDPPVDAPTVTVAIPRDIHAIRAADPDLAREWRIAVRETLGAELGRGSRVVSFSSPTGYLVERPLP